MSCFPLQHTRCWLDRVYGQDAALRSYGWVDKNAGIVRIPIDEAIRLTLQRGLPTRKGGK